MKRLRADRFHFEKAAGSKRVRGGRLEWEREIEKMLAESSPFVVQGGMETRIEWDENDPEKGFALGKVVVFNRPPQPAVLPRQDMQMQRLGVQDQGKSAIIPVHVENSELQSLVIFLDDKGMAHPLTEKRWSEVMGATGMMGEVDPNAPDTQGNNSMDMPRGAAGFDRLSNVKVAEDNGDFVLLEHGLRALHPSDQARIVKMASDPAILAGVAESRLFPIVRMILEARAVSTRDYDQAVMGSLPVNLVYIEEVTPSPNSPHPKKWRASLVSDRYYAPKYVEGSYRTVSDALSGLIPGVGAKLEQGGAHLIQLDRTRTCNPLVLEDVAVVPDAVSGGGHWMVMSKAGDVVRADVIANCFGIEGKPSGCMLFVGDGCFAMSTVASGRKVSDSYEMVTKGVPVGSPVRRGSWVSLCVNGKYTVPINVVSSAVVGGSPVLAGSTMSGETVAIRFVNGLRVITKASTSLPTAFGIAEGYARYYAPADATIIPLGDMFSIEDEPKVMEQRMASYVRTGAKVNGRNVMRFTLGDEAEHPLVVMRHFEGDQWGLAGLPVGTVMGQNSADSLAAANVKYILAVLGCTDAQIAKLMSQAEARGRITVTGLRGVRRVVEESGKIAVPYLQKMGTMAMRLRADVPDRLRENLFKAATCFDVVDIGQKVAEFVGEERRRSKLAFLGSILPQFYDRGGEAGLKKLAEIFAHPESIDVALGLNVLTERTVTAFLRNLSRMRRVEDHLAELLMLARQGLSGVKADDVEAAMTSLNRVVEKLEYLDKEVSQKASGQQYE